MLSWTRTPYSNFTKLLDSVAGACIFFDRCCRWAEAFNCATCAGLFDAQKEQQRLQKQQAKLEKDLQTLQSRLKNPKFVQNAKPEVVKEVQQSAAEGEQKLAQIQEKMQQIAHLL